LDDRITTRSVFRTTKPIDGDSAITVLFRVSSEDTVLSQKKQREKPYIPTTGKQQATSSVSDKPSSTMYRATSMIQNRPRSSHTSSTEYTVPSSSQNRQEGQEEGHHEEQEQGTMTTTITSPLIAYNTLNSNNNAMGRGDNTMVLSMPSSFRISSRRSQDHPGRGWSESQRSLSGFRTSGRSRRRP